ncbi:MAG: YihY/virulence factor BrkB family protein [Bacteroidales bacterium]|nr:YihY/virulence factor BrkB family protein [Bacteroidales bacterium]
MFKKLAHKINLMLRWSSIKITRIIRFLTHDIWYLNTQDFARWKGNLIQTLRTATLMISTFTRQKIGYQISALAYQSMLAVVPAIAVGLYMTDAIGLKDKFADILYENLGQTPLVETLVSAAEKIASIAESGLFGFISMASFIWIVLSLMYTVRQVFNNVWQVEKEKSILKAFGVIIGITILSPFVIILFFTGTVFYSHILDWLLPQEFFLSEHIRGLLSWASFAGICILLVSIMYKYIPGTKVHYKHALKAAVFAGIAFAAVQFLYLETQLMVAKQNAVYGVLAAIPLFMIWLNLGWSIILYGAELSYAFQNVNKHKSDKTGYLEK